MPPEDLRAKLRLPELTIDGLPRRAAEHWPDRVALVAGERSVTFDALEREVTRAAEALHRITDGVPGTIAVATVLDPVFATLYYATARSGNVVVSLNPLIREDGLRHILAVSHSKVAVVTAEMYERVMRIRDDLPELRTVVVLDCKGVTPGAGDLSWEALLAAPESDSAGNGRVDTLDLDATACLHFTSGTSGAPKAVRLTHRNLTANAAQTARAQGLDDTSVALNQLPLFHLMHLNSALWAGATQVLFPDSDAAAAVEAANTAGATHYFSLPVRLTHLAADPRLPGLALHTVGGIFSGGSALPVRPAAVLADHFGIPVVQGYGLAEASPLLTCDMPGRPKAGSCGPAVAATEIRILGLDTRRPVPAGTKGEIQARGPQLMKGYLGEAEGARLDADGWFSTGDVGYLDADGWLFLTDRLSDVFKRDNELVAPTEIEDVLARHPAVRECVVFGHPDEFSGHVPHALIALHDHAAGTTTAELTAYVDALVAPFQRLAYADIVPAVPRGRNGKIQRRELRQRFLSE